MVEPTDGSRSEQGKMMKTQTEFCHAMETKGKSKEWALNEFKRRQSCRKGIWKQDSCPDTGLPRVQMYSTTLEANFVEDSFGVDVRQTSANEKKRRRASLKRDGLRFERGWP